jgi:hypothetical protein
MPDIKSFLFEKDSIYAIESPLFQGNLPLLREDIVKLICKPQKKSKITTN